MLQARNKKRKPRLKGKHRQHLPKPVTASKDRGFSLRMIEEADGRLASVKLMRARLSDLMEDSGCDTVQQQWLAARGVFLLSYVETLECQALEGHQINWGQYLQAVKALSDVLSKLGLSRDVTRGVQRLQSYVEEASRKNGKS